MATSDDERVQREVEKKAAQLIGDIYSHPYATPPERIPAGLFLEAVLVDLVEILENLVN